MVRNIKLVKGDGSSSKTTGNLENDVDALFKLPLSEFIGARKTLAARLKQDGRADDASLVKALPKPSISAWAVNQLYWRHRDAFDQLLDAGERFRRAQTSGRGDKMTDLRKALEVRRETLSDLSDLATSLLRNAGHNPTPEMTRRITTTLEGISAFASLSDGPTAGRLTQDVDPPGFESLAAFMPGSGTKPGTSEPALLTVSPKSSSAVTKKLEKAASARDLRQLQETRRARIAAAKVSLQGARKSLTEARARAQRLEAAQKKAHAETKEAEKQRREAEERFKRASAASEAAAQHARSVANEATDAAKAAEDARHAVEKASKELESLFREST